MIQITWITCASLSSGTGSFSG